MDVDPRRNHPAARVRRRGSHGPMCDPCYAATLASGRISAIPGHPPLKLMHGRMACAGMAAVVDTLLVDGDCHPNHFGPVLDACLREARARWN
jgi:hypothetical protein